MSITFQVVQTNLLDVGFELRVSDDTFVIRDLTSGFEWTFGTIEEADAFYYGASDKCDKDIKNNID